jgi:hypothetical protein
MRELCYMWRERGVQGRQPWVHALAATKPCQAEATWSHVSVS